MAPSNHKFNRFDLSALNIIFSFRQQCLSLHMSVWSRFLMLYVRASTSYCTYGLGASIFCSFPFLFSRDFSLPYPGDVKYPNVHVPYNTYNLHRWSDHRRLGWRDGQTKTMVLKNNHARLIGYWGMYIFIMVWQGRAKSMTKKSSSS